MLRNPIERAISDYYQQSGTNQASLEETILQEQDRIKQQSESQLGYGGGILTQGLYYYKIKRWMQIFPQNQFLIINSDRFFVQPSETMRQVFDFLNLPSVEEAHYLPHNKGAYPQVSSSLKQLLGDFFEPYNQKLEEYLGRKFDW